MPQGSFLNDPCGGSGMLVYEVFEPAHQIEAGDGGLMDVPGRRRTIAARCLCERGQLQLSPAIPLISNVVREYADLQELFPEGVPAIIERVPLEQAPDRKTREHGTLCKCGHRESQHDGELSNKPCRSNRPRRCPCMVFRPRRV